MAKPSVSTAVVGIGNLLRGDDAIGIVIARNLKERNLAGVEVLESNGDVTDLLNVFERFHHVHLIDAVHVAQWKANSQGRARIIRFNLLEEDIPALDPASSSHVLGVGQAVELAKLLNKLPSQLEFWGVEGQSFTLGSELSSSVRNSIEDVTRSLVARIHEEKNHA